MHEHSQVFLEEVSEVGFLKDQNLSHLFYIPCQFSVEMLSSHSSDVFNILKNSAVFALTHKFLKVLEFFLFSGSR